MRRAKELFLENAERKEQRHPHTANKVIFFILGMAFFGLSVLLLGVAHAPIYNNLTASWVKSMMILFAVVTLQAAVAFCAVGVTSSRYTLYCISSATLSVSLAMDVALAVYYLVWVV